MNLLYYFVNIVFRTHYIHGAFKAFDVSVHTGEHPFHIRFKVWVHMLRKALILQHFRQIITDIFRDADDPVFQILTVRVILRIFPRFGITG